MAVAANKVLKLLATGLIIIAAGGFMYARHNKSVSATVAPGVAADSGAPSADTVGPMTMSSTENNRMSADGDTAKDTVATLIAEVKGLKSQVASLTEDNKKLQNENKDLSGMEGNINARLDQKLRQDSEQKTLLQQQTDQKLEKTSSLLQTFQDRLNGLHSSGQEVVAGPSGTTGNALATDVPVGLGLHPGENGVAWSGSTSNNISTPPSIVWVDPLSKQSIFSKSVATGSGDKVKAVGASIKDALPDTTAISDRLVPKIEPDLPVYTINRDATLIGSVTMTALIGRVPIGGQVQDPYKFKLLVGAENLAANGVKIPGLDSMVISGVATGDWGLSCVRGDITSATFVFQDGTIRSYPKPDRSASNSTNSSTAKKTFGYISDKFGIPCVTGERKTNAVQFLATRIGLASAQAAAEAAAAAETSTVASGQTGALTTAVTGSPSLFAKNKAISSGIQESSNWVKERQAQSFDAIFVRNGADVAIHIDEEIPIDYEPTGRKVNHHPKLQFSDNSEVRKALD